MTKDAVDILVRQLDIAWALTSYHLSNLSTDECLWRPRESGPHVYLDPGGDWVSDWPTHEGYDLGPPSIAWLTWHIIFWWSMALDHSFGSRTLARGDVRWPGDADAAASLIADLHERWRGEINALGPQELDAADRTHWPFTDRPFVDVISWVNVELMKNAAEIGYARFLYATRHQART